MIAGGGRRERRRREELRDSGGQDDVGGTVAAVSVSGAAGGEGGQRGIVQMNVTRAGALPPPLWEKTAGKTASHAAESQANALPDESSVRSARVRWTGHCGGGSERKEPAPIVMKRGAGIAGCEGKCGL